MTDKIEISKVEIKMGKHTFNLTLDQARSLKKILNDTFPEKETQFVPTPYPVYPTPYPVYPPVYPQYNEWIITCGGTEIDNTLCLSTE